MGKLNAGALLQAAALEWPFLIKGGMRGNKRTGVSIEVIECVGNI